MKNKKIVKVCSVVVALSLIMGLNSPDLVRAMDTEQVEFANTGESVTEIPSDETGAGEILETIPVPSMETIPMVDSSSPPTNIPETIVTEAPTSSISIVNSSSTETAVDTTTSEEITSESTVEGVDTLTSTPSELENSSASEVTAFVTPYATLDSWMPDVNLQNRVAEILGVTVAEITPELMLSLTNFTEYRNTIADLTGLEKAVNLKVLYLYSDQISYVDVSSFTLLEELNVDNAKITTLAVENLVHLKQLFLRNNQQLSSLTISSLPALINLHITQSEIEVLHIADFPMLQSFYMTNAPLKTLEMRNLPQFKFLNLDDLKLTTLAVENFLELTNLTIGRIPSLNEVIINNLPSLLYFQAYETSLKKIKIENFPELLQMNINQSLLEEITLTNLPKLSTLDLNGNMLTTFSLAGLSELSNLDLSDNRLTSLEISNLPLLNGLYMNNNLMVEVSLANLPALQWISAANNNLTRVRLNDLPLLYHVGLTKNYIFDLRDVEISNLSPTVNFEVSEQKVENKRLGVNQATSLPQAIDRDGNTLLWNFSGTEGINYNLDGNNITWLTSGKKTMTISSYSTSWQFSVVLEHIVIGVPDAEGWIEISDVTTDSPALITNFFTRNGIDYKVESGYFSSNISSLLLNEGNVVTNLTTGQRYTYSYSQGNGYYSNLWFKTDNTDQYSDIGSGNQHPKIFIHIDSETGKEKFKKVYGATAATGFSVTIITEVTDAGAIKHRIEVTNLLGATRTNLALLARIDTQLNQNDAINLYANGAGGAYMTSDGFILYGEPLEGTTRVYAGRYNNFSQSHFDSETNSVKSAFGKAKDAILAKNVDSGLYFGPDFQDLAPDETIVFSYQERIYSEAEPEPEPENAITVRYQDEDGVDLEVATVLVGNPGEAYTTEQKTFPDHIFLQVEGEVAGTFTYEPKTITYIYKKADGSPVEVRYLDGKGRIVSPTITLEGKIGASYTTEQKVIAGYTFTRVEGLTTGIFTNSPQTVIYTYALNIVPIKEGEVKVSYVTESGGKLQADLLLRGAVGITYTTEQKTFPGYEFSKMKGNTSGTFGLTPQTVMYIYKLVDIVEEGKIIVRYMDAVGTKLDNDLELVGVVGSAYKTEAKFFENYELDKVMGKVEGNFKNTLQTVSYTYKLLDTSEVSVGELVIRYQDENGKLLMDDITLRGTLNDSYATEQKVFANYTFVKIEGEERGTFGINKKTVTYHYKKSLIQVIGGAGNNTNKSDSASGTRSGGSLSKTGESTGWVMGVGVIGIVLALGILFFLQKKRKEIHFKK